MDTDNPAQRLHALLRELAQRQSSHLGVQEARSAVPGIPKRDDVRTGVAGFARILDDLDRVMARVYDPHYTALYDAQAADWREAVLGTRTAWNASSPTPSKTRHLQRSAPSDPPSTGWNRKGPFRRTRNSRNSEQPSLRHSTPSSTTLPWQPKSAHFWFAGFTTSCG